MMLTPLQRDELRALVHRQDVVGVEAFVEKLLPAPAPKAEPKPAAKPKAKGRK